MRISFVTLGCKVNQYESQAMERMLAARGHITAPQGEPSDAVIINTCAVTGESARKSRQAIRRARRLNPDAIVAVSGCFSQSDSETVRALGVDYVGGAGERTELIEFICGAEGGSGFISDPFSRRSFEELPAGEAIGHTRSLLKVQDGCVNFCSYCIIPYLRGPSRSMPLDRAVAAAEDLSKGGSKEIVLTGIEISSYGLDIGSSLAELTEGISMVTGGSRIRLGSLEPGMVTEDFIRRVSALPNLCPHFHLSLQSGSGAVLERMRRKYTPGEFLNSVKLIREYFDDPAITTDIIFGFPGETDEEFAETLAFMEKVSFAAAHIFPYSVREGTRAASMGGHLTKSIKESRTAAAAAVAKRTSQEYRDRQRGRILEVLFETERDGFQYGHSENYLEVAVKGGGLKGQLQKVIITGRSGGVLMGELI